jgi:hypothetical protein
MRKPALATMMVLLGACGGLVKAPADGATRPEDAASIGQGDLTSGNERETVAPGADAIDVPVDSVAGDAEVGRVEVSAVDVMLAGPDLAPGEAGLAADIPLVADAGAVDVGALGERPRPIDGSSAACEDRVLSYDDRVPGAYMSTVNSLAFSPDGQWLAAGIEHSLTAWQLGSGSDAGVADGGSIADGGVVDGGACRGYARTCPASIYALAYLPDGRLAGLFCGGAFIIFGCEIAPQFFGSFAVSPVGQMVASASGPVRLWDTMTGDVVRTLASEAASSLAFSPDGALLVGGIAATGVRIWDVASGAELATLPMAAAGSSVTVAVSPDGRWIGALSSASFQVWNLRTHASVATFAVDPLAQSFVFTRDGSAVVTGGAKVNAYAVSDGSLLYQMGDRTYVVALSPDGTRLAASGGVGVPVNLYCLY